MSIELYERLLKPPKQSFFLFGLRGAGKSTWVRQAFPDAVRFDLLDEGLYQGYLRDARLFGRELLGVPQGHIVVVDEVQRLPSLLNEVHRFIEERRLRFVLLGSSLKGQVNSIVCGPLNSIGRFDLRRRKNDLHRCP